MGIPILNRLHGRPVPVTDARLAAVRCPARPDPGRLRPADRTVEAVSAWLSDRLAAGPERALPLVNEFERAHRTSSGVLYASLSRLGAIRGLDAQGFVTWALPARQGVRATRGRG